MATTCTTCGYKIRGNDHKNGTHHQAAVNSNPPKRKPIGKVAGK